MTRSRRSVEKRLVELEQDDFDTPELTVEITRHTVESFRSDAADYHLETVSESELLTVREAVVDDSDDAGGDRDA